MWLPIYTICGARVNIGWIKSKNSSQDPTTKERMKVTFILTYHSSIASSITYISNIYHRHVLFNEVSCLKRRNLWLDCLKTNITWDSPIYWRERVQIDRKVSYFNSKCYNFYSGIWIRFRWYFKWINWTPPIIIITKLVIIHMISVSLKQESWHH